MYQALYGEHNGDKYHNELNEMADETFEVIRHQKNDFYESVKKYDNDDDQIKAMILTTHYFHGLESMGAES